MIAAERVAGLPPAGIVADYKAMRDFWHVTPFLETALGQPLRNVLDKRQI